MGNITTTENGFVPHRAHVGVECPRCHWRQLMEVDLDKTGMDLPMAQEIRSQLAAWMASHCPDHLNTISMLSRN